MKTYSYVIHSQELQTRGIDALVTARARRNARYPLIELKTVISEANYMDIYGLFQMAQKMRADIFNIMVLSMLPHTNQLGGGGHASILQSPPMVTGVEPKELREQLRKIAKEAPLGGIQVRTTPQGISFDTIVDYYANAPQAFADCRCYYPWYGSGITAFGDVSICPYVMLGNITKSSLPELLNHESARLFRTSLKRRRSFPGCRGCCMLVP